MQHHSINLPTAMPSTLRATPCCASAAASVELLIQPHARQRSLHIIETRPLLRAPPHSQRSPTTTNCQLRSNSNALHSPCSTSTVAIRSRRRQQLNTTVYRQLHAPPCLVINRSRDTIRSSSSSSRSISSRAGATAGHRQPGGPS